MKESVPDAFPLSMLLARVSARDAMVFKSILTLISGRSRVNWQQIESGTPDLLILGTEPGAPLPAMQPRATLYIGEQTGADPRCTVNSPLRAHPVLECLDHITDLLLSPAQSTASLPACEYRLLRWPERRLLTGGVQQLRMVTLLSTRSMTLAELCQLSGASQSQAETLIATLQDAGVLQQNAASAPAATIDSVSQLGFFARLRAHLGIASRGAATQ